MNAEMTEIIINEWQEYGNGGTARTYVKNDDITVILKLFTSHADYYRRLIKESSFYSKKLKSRLQSYVDELESATTCLHGDLTISNIVSAAGKDYWIDLGDFGYGDPYLDLGRHGTPNR